MFEFIQREGTVFQDRSHLYIKNSEFNNIFFEYEALIDSSSPHSFVQIENSLFDKVSNCGSIVKNFKTVNNLNFFRDDGV